MQREVKVDRLKIEPLETKLDLSHALNCEMDADGTRYSLIVIPFEGYLGCGFISTSDSFLVVDGGEKTAYAFRENPNWSYVWEKLIRGYRQGDGEMDAINTAHLIQLAQAEIVKQQANMEEPDETQRRMHEETVIYHFGEGRLEEENKDEEDEGETEEKDKDE